jgi:hypothetical protein
MTGTAYATSTESPRTRPPRPRISTSRIPSHPEQDGGDEHFVPKQQCRAQENRGRDSTPPPTWHVERDNRGAENRQQAEEVHLILDVESWWKEDPRRREDQSQAGLQESPEKGEDEHRRSQNDQDPVQHHGRRNVAHRGRCRA